MPKPDKKMIAKLTAIACHQWGRCWKDGLMELVKMQGLQHPESLRVGVTEVRSRWWSVGAAQSQRHRTFTSLRASLSERRRTFTSLRSSGTLRIERLTV